MAVLIESFVVYLYSWMSDDAVLYASLFARAVEVLKNST